MSTHCKTTFCYTIGNQRIDISLDVLSSTGESATPGTFALLKEEIDSILSRLRVVMTGAVLAPPERAK